MVGPDVTVQTAGPAGIVQTPGTTILWTEQTADRTDSWISWDSTDGGANWDTTDI